MHQRAHKISAADREARGHGDRILPDELRAEEAVEDLVRPQRNDDEECGLTRHQVAAEIVKLDPPGLDLVL
jgi:hypothetical protein